MRPNADSEKIKRLLETLGQRAKGTGRLYLTGGATAVLLGFRPTTVDVDIKLSPEPQGVFEAIRTIKDELGINIELASPDNFIPEIPDWQKRSLYVGTYGKIEVFHYDFYAQALAKIERGHERDIRDVKAMLEHNHITLENLKKYFELIKPLLQNYPGLDAHSFQQKVESFSNENSL